MYGVKRIEQNACYCHYNVHNRLENMHVNMTFIFLFISRLNINYGSIAVIL